MKAGRYDFEIEQGSTFNRSFNFSDTDLDLTDYTGVRMMIRRIPGGDIIWDSTADTPGGSIEVLDSATIKLIIDADTTKQFKFDEAGYDIELFKDETPEIVDKPMKGRIVLSKEYTR